MTLDPAELQTAGLEKVWRAAAELPDEPDPGDLAGLRSRLAGIPVAVVTEIVTQTLLRRRARAKFGPVADTMFFTRPGLEQSSRPLAAARRARRLVGLGCSRMFDLGCGIGADALAAHRCGLAVVAVESDPTTAAVAAANLRLPGRALQSPPAQVLRRDAMTIAVPADAVAFVDPGRRLGHRGDGSSVRTVTPDRWQPPWSWVTAMASRHPLTVAKVAPGIPHGAIPDGCATEWVSIDGDLVEAVVWFPGLVAQLPRRSAVLLRTGTDPWLPGTEIRLESEDPQPAEAGPLGDWLLEPDPAIIRSGLVDVTCARVDGRLVSPGIAYITTDERPPTELGRGFRIEAVLPARPKALRRALSDRGVSSLTIRTRGLALDPQRLRRELRLPAQGTAAELVMTRALGDAVALLVDPIG